MDSAPTDCDDAPAVSTPSERPAIRLAGLSKTYAGAKQKAVDNLSLDVRMGEVFTLLGPSGCGKSTTLRMVAGLEEPDEGTIHFEDRLIFDAEQNVSLQPEKRNIGMVFQSYAIWPHMTVAENVAFPLQARRVARNEIPRRVSQVLELVGMQGMEKRPAPLLSGGQQQRVALARALVTEPSILLLDEPFSNLDAKLREQMRIEVKLIQERLNIAVLFVTHDQVEALSLSDRIAIMNSGQVVQEGTPFELYEQPANEFVRDFIGKTILFQGVVKASNMSGQLALDIDGAPSCVVFGSSPAQPVLAEGRRVLIGVRPEDVELVPADSETVPDGMIGAKIETALYLGDRIEYQVAVGAQNKLILHGDRHLPHNGGENVWLKLRSDGHTAWAMPD